MKIYPEGSKRAAVSRMFPVWERLGHTIVYSPKGADVQLSVARIANKSEVPTVLRIDGVYYDAGIDFNRANKSISDSHKIADAVVYQSHTSKKMSERYLEPHKQDCKTYVIHNGIDPVGWNNPKKHKGIRVYCSGKWRRPKRLEEIIEIFYQFRGLQRYPKSVELHVLGGFKKGGKEIPGENIIYHGMVNHERMRSLYTKGDVFIHLCKRDSCPSSVVEAIASGMPIITTNACGGAAEMAWLGKGNEAVNCETFTLEPEFIYKDNCHNIPDGSKHMIVSAMHTVVKYKQRTQFPGKLHIDYVAKKYLDVIESILI